MLSSKFASRRGNVHHVGHNLCSHLAGREDIIKVQGPSDAGTASCPAVYS